MYSIFILWRHWPTVTIIVNHFIWKALWIYFPRNEWNGLWNWLVYQFLVYYIIMVLLEKETILYKEDIPVWVATFRRCSVTSCIVGVTEGSCVPSYDIAGARSSKYHGSQLVIWEILYCLLEFFCSIIRTWLVKSLGGLFAHVLIMIWNCKLQPLID